MFPKFTIEDGFAEDDPYWGKKESFDDVKARANSILDSIFDTDNDDKNCKHFFMVFQTDAVILIIFGSNSSCIDHQSWWAYSCYFRDSWVFEFRWHPSRWCVSNYTAALKGHLFISPLYVLGVVPFIC